MLQWFYPTLGSPDALGLRSMSLPCLAGLSVVGSLSNVRCRIQVPVVCSATGGAVRLGVVLHVQIRLADVTLPGRIRRIHSQYSAAVSLNHIPSPPVHLATKPAAKPHGVTDVR